MTRAHASSIRAKSAIRLDSQRIPRRLARLRKWTSEQDSLDCGRSIEVGPRVVPTHLNLDEGAMDRRILVVDDSELIGQQLSQLLNTPGREISVAHEGTTALEWLVERPYSLVLTDLRLPGISGLDLIREIRNRSGSIPAHPR